MLGVVIEIGTHRVVGRPRVGDTSLLTKLLEAHIEHVNLRPGRALKG
jgi:hypothetical protein